MDYRDVAGNAGARGSQRADAALPVETLTLANQIQERLKLLRTHEDVDVGEAASQLVGLGARPCSPSGR